MEIKKPDRPKPETTNFEEIGTSYKTKIDVENLNILQKYIILLLGADDSKPIPSFEHLEHMIFLCAKNDPELQEFLDRHSSEQKVIEE